MSRCVVALLLATACEGLPPECRDVQGEPSAEIGQGIEAFAPLTDGETVPVDFGPQLLFHTYGTMRVSGIYPGDGALNERSPSLTFTVESDDGEVSGGFEDLLYILEPVGDLWGTVGELLVLNKTATEAAGRAATLRLELTDACGTVVSDTKSVVFDGT
jgi:hypothetical protein